MFSLLSLLYPSVNLQNHHHVDHVYPRSGFRASTLRKAGLSDEQIEHVQSCKDKVGNLQLLEGHVNQEKQAAMPGEWLARMYSDEASRQAYQEQQLLGVKLGNWDEFPEFYQTRRNALRSRLQSILASEVVEDADAGES